MPSQQDWDRYFNTPGDDPVITPSAPAAPAAPGQSVAPRTPPPPTDDPEWTRHFVPGVSNLIAGGLSLAGGPITRGWELAHHFGLARPVPPEIEQEGLGQWATEYMLGHQPPPQTTLGRIGGAAERGFGEGLPLARYDPLAPFITAGSAATAATANELYYTLRAGDGCLRP